MQAFDASSMIYAWDNYPIRQFPGLWQWMATQMEEKRLAMPMAAFEVEVAKKTPDCADWLKDHDLYILKITNSILQEALRIKQLIGIKDDKYYANGVGENDLLIIATASIHRAELISDEERQTLLPKVSGRRKIPAVCAMKEVAVPCISFIEFIKRSEVIFR